MARKTKYFGYKKDNILKHLKQEKAESLKYVMQKRRVFRDRLADYVNISKNDDVIYVRRIFAVMQTLMSLHYSDRMTAMFTGRQTASFEIANNIQHLAEFDYDELGLDKSSYNIERDRLFYGKAFYVYTGWDRIKNAPMFRRMSPMCWLPCYKKDLVLGERYSHFQLENDIAYFQSDQGFMNTKGLHEKAGERADKGIGRYTQDINDETELFQQKVAEIRMLTYLGPQGDSKTFTTPTDYCFTHLGGEKFFIVTVGNHEEIVKMEKVKPVFKEEKINPRNIRFPIIDFDYSPFEGDPFGVNIGDLLADKQKAEQILMNLQLVKAKHSAWGDMFLVDTTRVNTKDLKKPTKGPKFIKHKGPVDAGSMVVEVPKERVSGDVTEVTELLRQQARFDIGLDERAMGVSGDRNITATETQNIQKNANIKQLLQTKVKQWGWKEFWRTWYRSYHENFDRKSVKNIVINTRLGQTPLTVKKKDIITGMDIDIKIVNKSELDAEKEKERAGFFATLPMVLQDPEAPAISRNLAKRKAFILSGVAKDEAMIYVPPTFEEMQANAHVDLINNNKLPDLPNIGEDIRTYVVIYQRAINTRAKFIAMETVKLMYMRLKQAGLLQAL